MIDVRKTKTHREWVEFLHRIKAEREVLELGKWQPPRAFTPEEEARIKDILSLRGPGCGCCSSF